MKRRPGLVSIIMPTHNCGRFIAEAIGTIRAQSYTAWELLIVDDGSTDDTEAVVRPLLHDRRIRYLREKRQRGAAHARNRALREARGRWIAFCDSDDRWHPEKLALQLAFMKRHGHAFSYTAYEEIDERSQPLGRTIRGPQRITRRGMQRYCWPGCLTVMYDTRSVGRVQIPPIGKNNDYALWLRVIRRADCHLLDEMLAQYRRRSGSLSRRSIFSLIPWHYRLFRQVEGQGAIRAAWSTLRNLFFGAMKRIFYVRRNPVRR